MDEKAAWARWQHLTGAVGRLHAADAHTLRQQVRIAGVAAPTGAEASRGKFVASALRTSGWRNVFVDSVGNVRAVLVPDGVDDSASAVVCLAHLDTVFDAETPLIATTIGSQVQCPGIGDNGRGLAALLALADALRVPDLLCSVQRPIELVATVGEEGEGNLRGARHFFDDRAHRGIRAPVACVVLDGPGDTAIAHYALGSVRLRVRIIGVGGHSWVDYGTPNPIHAMAIAMAAVARLGAERTPMVAVTISRVSGGESLTSIPVDASFDLDMRSTDALALTNVVHEVRRIVHQVIADASRHVTVHGRIVRDAPLRAEIITLGERPGGSLTSTHPLVALAASATRWQLCEPVSSTASTDANIPLSRGIPAITIGAGGRGGGAHSLQEWYDNTNGMRGVVRALAIIVALAAQPNS